MLVEKILQFFGHLVVVLIPLNVFKKEHSSLQDEREFKKVVGLISLFAFSFILLILTYGFLIYLYV